MARFISIFANNSPVDIGTDEEGRHQYSTNFECEFYHTGSTAVDVAKLLSTYLQTQGLGTVGTDIFYRSGARIPPDSTTTAHLFLSGSLPPMLNREATERVSYASLQVVVRSKGTAANTDPGTTAINLAYQIYDELDGVTNQDIP